MSDEANLADETLVALYADVESARPQIRHFIGEKWAGWYRSKHPDPVAAREAGLDTADKLLDLLLVTAGNGDITSRVSDRPVLDFAARMLAIAKADRSAAILLWDARNHPLAISHVIQCCEKASKTIVIALKANSVKEASQYGHQAVKNILSLIKTELGNSMLDVQSALEMQDRRKLFEEVFAKVDANTWDAEVRSMKRGAITRYFRILKRIPDILSVVPEVEMEVKNAIADLLPRWRPQIMSAELWLNMTLSEVLVKLYLLTAFMNPHRNTTRYPQAGSGPEDSDRLASIIEIVKYEVLTPMTGILKQLEEVLLTMRNGYRVCL